MNFQEIAEKVWVDPVLSVAIPVFIVFIFLEAWVLHMQHRPKYDRKDAWASIAMGLGSAIINLGSKAVAYIGFSLVYAHALFPDLAKHWWSWLILLFLDDLSFYMHHRSSHEVRILWAAHVNHHSSQNYNLAVALRQSWGELIHKYIWWAWLPFIGFHPLQVITMISISLVYQFFLHTEAVGRLGPLEWFFNTPSHHRVHHAKNVRYLDRNHAGIFIIWDRLLGTFQRELPEEQVVYGITNDIHTYNPFRIASHAYGELWDDLKRAPGFGNKLKYIFMPPGWSHDGHSKTANEMRRELKNG
ncbi:MAG: sterol desaturase family protein [Bacteroidia bacterium]|nr:sterol desaturase family protein [Bacteroidia bacterium]